VAGAWRTRRSGHPCRWAWAARADYEIDGARNRQSVKAFSLPSIHAQSAGLSACSPANTRSGWPLKLTRTSAPCGNNWRGWWFAAACRRGSKSRRPAGYCRAPGPFNRRRGMASRQRDKSFPQGEQERSPPTSSAPAPRWTHVPKAVSVAVAADMENEELLPDRLRRGLHFASLRLGIRIVRVHQHGDCCRLGHELAQKLQSRRPQHRARKDYSRGLAAWGWRPGGP
jgi:hypothetical protein